MTTDGTPPQHRESAALPLADDDLPLRENRSSVAWEPPRSEDERTDAIVARAFLSPAAERAPARPNRSVGLLASTLIALVVGVAVGFVLGQRSARAPQGSVAAETQSYTEAPVPPTPVTEEPLAEQRPPAVEGPLPSDQSRRASEKTRPTLAASGPGAMQVLSRPSGANVFLDGRLIGRTPLTLSNVSAGQHDIRLELPGHRRWATTVNIVPGERTRVAGSLEPNAGS